MQYIRRIFYNFTVILMLFTTLGQSIKCYQCSSVKDYGCDNAETWDENTDFYKDCVGDYGNNEPFCRKTVQRIIEANEIRVHRYCGFEPEIKNSTSCYTYQNDFHLDIRCVCYTDGCNSAPRIDTTWMLWILLIIASVTSICLRI